MINININTFLIYSMLSSTSTHDAFIWLLSHVL